MIESDKYIPNCDLSEIQTDDGESQLVFVFSVEEEGSAKDFEIDLSSDELKLSSKK